MPSIGWTYFYQEGFTRAERRLRSGGRQWLKLARRDVPVKTGRLKRSLFWRVKFLPITRMWKLSVGTRGVHYASYQEDLRSYGGNNWMTVKRRLDKYKDQEYAGRRRRERRQPRTRRSR